MVNKLVLFFVNLMQKYLPNPFTIAWIITLVVFVLAFAITGTNPLKTVQFWGNDFFGILSFAMQMTLLIVSGYAFAVAKPMGRFLRRIARIPNTPKQTILFVAFVSMILYWFNWGLGLIAGALLAREIAKIRQDVDFRAVVAAAWSGIIITHGGLSASVPLLSATPGHFLEKEIGVVPLSLTMFNHQTLFITIVLAIIIPFICLYLIPKKENMVIVDPAVFKDDEEIIAPPPANPTLADSIDKSKILKYSLAIIGTVYIGYFFATKGFELNMNILIFIFVILGVWLHDDLTSYSDAMTKGATSAGGIILQYPFYAAIMGLMKGSGLVYVISDGLLHLATYNTFEFYCYLSSLIISIFVPSAGGHWVVQAPFMLPAAHTLGVEPWKVIMGVAWGESIWNVVCPFWALPLLAIANISIRDLIGFTMLLFLVGNVVAIAGIFLFP
ncbi:MAG: TIGR00366 family protein [Negativicutes bacterium]|nr:TIGR00366 family protein [Negativicutes bacterium]